MHIIKITPCSFKIILSKDDLARSGRDNIFNHTDISGDFFAQIIDETNRLYGNPFTEGSVDAEFFASKDGGGELFLSKSNTEYKHTYYIFITQSTDSLVMLCKRLSFSGITYDSSLYHADGNYSLIIFSEKRDSLLLSVLKEYGSASETSSFRTWLLDEHASIILEKDAVTTIAEKL